MALCISCIPTSAAFQYKYALLLGIVVYYAKFYEDIKVNGACLPLIFMMFWEFLHFRTYADSYNELFRGFAEIMFITFIMLDKNIKIDYPLICRTLAVATIAMCYIVLGNLLRETGNDFAGIFTGTYRFGIGNAEAENFGVNYNANALGFLCILAMVGLLQLFSLKKQKISDIVMIVALIFFGLLTMSRSYVLSLALVVVLFLLSKKGGMGKSIKYIFGVGILLGIAYLIMFTYAPFIIEGIMERFRANDISNGRFDLFAFYNKHIFSELKYLFFGIGMQNIPYKIYTIYDTFNNVPHNGLQEILVAWGMPGLIMFIMLIINLIRRSRTSHGLINYIPLLLILFKIQAGQFITGGETLLALVFCYASFCVAFKEGVKDEIKQN